MFGARDEQIRRQSAHAVGVYRGVVVLLGGVVALGGGGRSRTVSHLPILTIRQWTSSRQSKQRMDRRLTKGPHLQRQEIIESGFPAWTKCCGPTGPVVSIV
jgi:hypothetical protein